ncbi:hypothetical protein SFMTTN_1731 [Sulfuriferula multivorans]|uniref:Uncharacterized protein n=1 Tax=Sulfuriferula multivorans TaxID=1559896 RepID=A0A401JE92_9PROT|nr:hypothetical protein SFMTTN_1731 [Sulfuriferula multivorans]
MKPAILPLNTSYKSLAANECDKCGHVTNISDLLANKKIVDESRVEQNYL